MSLKIHSPSPLTLSLHIFVFHYKCLFHSLDFFLKGNCLLKTSFHKSLGDPSLICFDFTSESIGIVPQKIMSELATLFLVLNFENFASSLRCNSPITSNSHCILRSSFEEK